MTTLKDGACQIQDQRKYCNLMKKLFKIKIEKIGKKPFNLNFNIEDEINAFLYLYFLKSINN